MHQVGELRHSFASDLRVSGHAAFVLRGLLGHGSIEMTERYAQLATEGPAVLRVRASLGAQLPESGGNGFLSRPRHYWVDVDVAGDGTLYIKRVTPIDDDPQLFVP